MSPRLEAVLREHAVFAADCPQGYPDTLAKAAFALDEDAFGRATGKVVHSCIALWQDISAAEARVHGCRASQVITAASGLVRVKGQLVCECCFRLKMLCYWQPTKFGKTPDALRDYLYLEPGSWLAGCDRWGSRRPFL